MVTPLSCVVCKFPVEGLNRRLLLLRAPSVRVVLSAVLLNKTSYAALVVVAVCVTALLVSVGVAHSKPSVPLRKYSPSSAPVASIASTPAAVILSPSPTFTPPRAVVLAVFKLIVRVPVVVIAVPELLTVMPVPYVIVTEVTVPVLLVYPKPVT